MRVVGGIYRSRKLVGFDGLDVRPTADRVKESLFNILGNKIIGASFLDAFAGTGGMGIEAVSRGADFVEFVDCADKSVSIIQKNLKNLGLSNKVIKSDTLSYLKKSQPFDIVFIDPPYKGELGKNALEIIGERGLLTDNGIAVYEHEEPFSGEINGLAVYDERKYGRAYLTFFKKESL